MERIQTDILVAGGGIAGLTAAACFVAEGFEVICVDQAPAPAKSNGVDLRSTAFLQPSVDLLREAGLWAALAPHATALKIMRIIDAGGAENVIRDVADFDPAEIGQEAFGYNLPNTVLKNQLVSSLEKMPQAKLLHATGLKRVTPRLNGIIAKLSDSTSVEARLLIAADGRDSFVREALGIKAQRWGYGQKALVFTVCHTLPHDNISTEIHRSGGPFTLVPLPDHGGAHHSAVVWMETGSRVSELQHMPGDVFAAELNDRAFGVLGQLELVSERVAWPIISQLADDFAGQRTALVAEAAHVVPPIGAQGLNTSLGDIAELRDLIRAAHGKGEDIGDPTVLEAYGRKRRAIVKARVAGIDALNRAAMAESKTMQNLRGVGMKTLFGVTPVRRSLMQLGLG